MKRAVPLFITFVVLGAAARLLGLTFLRPLNWDEIEHFRATNWIAHGLVPFVDFWEHHTPLHWYLFAPFARLTNSPGVDAIIFMRWTQVPLWLVTFWLLHVWMRNAGLDRFARWAATVIVAGSSLLMIPAGEYRPDSLAAMFYMAGLVLLQRERNRARNAFLAGVLFCLAGLTNLRLGPLLAITVLLARVMDRRAKRWQGDPPVAWSWAGAAAMLAVALGLFASTGALVPFAKAVWLDNFVGNKIQEGIAFMFLNRIVNVFGFFLFTTPGESPFDWGAVDVGGMALVILGSIGVVRALIERRRAPDDFWFLAALQTSSILFICAMKFVYNYHFVIVAVMMTPFIALEIERLGENARRWVIALAALVCVVNIAATLFRGKEGDRAYQDLIMRETDRRTPPGSRVWDGAGWALRRTPAYRYWFLPSLVRALEKRGDFEGLPPSQFLADMPAAVIGDHYALLWLGTHPPLGALVTSHYFPVWRNLWIPAPNGVVTPAAPARRWLVPADGTYRLVASKELARHAWFRSPLAAAHTATPIAQQLPIRLDAFPTDVAVEWRANGAVITTPVRLKKGDQLDARLQSGDVAALLAVPGDDQVLFREPPPEVTLEASFRPRTHVPDFTARFPTSSGSP